MLPFSVQSPTGNLSTFPPNPPLQGNFLPSENHCSGLWVTSMQWGGSLWYWDQDDSADGAYNLIAGMYTLPLQGSVYAHARVCAFCVGRHTNASACACVFCMIMCICACEYGCVYTCACLYVLVSVHLRAHMFTCTYVCTRKLHMHTFVCVCEYAHTFVCMHVCAAFMCMCAHTYTCVFVCLYIVCMWCMCVVPCVCACTVGTGTWVCMLCAHKYVHVCVFVCICPYVCILVGSRVCTHVHL